MADRPVTRRRALVADDDASARRFFARLLSIEGFEVSSAANGQEAREILGDLRFDIVLSDIAMPGMGGIQLLRAVREVDLDVPVILITGDPSVETAAKAVEYGALRYLVKPVKAKELREIVRYATRIHDLARVKREALALSNSAGMAADAAGLETTFERGLETLWMAYQPIIDPRKRSVVAYEALMRSGEPTLPNPCDLLDAAERLGCIHQLGRAIRERVSSALARGATQHDVFVNLHPAELEDELLYSRSAPLTRYAERVVLEVTERDRIDQIGGLDKRVETLRELGFRFAIDDLGAGYAGLQSFVHLQPDIVKIDMGLVRNLHRDKTKARLIQSISELCSDMKIRTIAEGIERPEERDRATELGVDLLQGFLFSIPQRGFAQVAESTYGWSDREAAAAVELEKEPDRV